MMKKSSNSRDFLHTTYLEHEDYNFINMSIYSLSDPSS